MGRYWKLNCPYCHSEYDSGYGYGDSLPDIFVPFLRCMICGKLFLTGKNEYLTMPVEQRTKLRNTKSNCNLIAESIARTSNEEYVKLLEENGFKIYPITETDITKFTQVNFDENKNSIAAKDATEILYNLGILISDEYKDEKSGGIKEEILQQNQKQYVRNKRIIKYGLIVGIIVGIVSIVILNQLTSNAYISLLGIPLGFAAYFATGFCFGKYYKVKGKNDDIKIQNNNPTQSTVMEATEQPLNREQRWKLQQQKDDEVLNSGSEFAKQILTSSATLNAFWDTVATVGYFENSEKNSEIFACSLTAKTFLQNYYLFKAGDRDLIKDHIYKNYPYIVHETIINMGIYIFETQNNIHVLEYIINSELPEFQSSKLKAKQILEAENKRV